VNIREASRRHIVELSRRWRARLSVALLALLAHGLVEGAGILLLLPLLASVGIDVGRGSVGRLSAAVVAAFSAFRISPTLPIVLAVFVAANAVLAMLRRIGLTLSASLERDVALDNAERLYDAVLRMEWTQFTRLRSSDLTLALTVECERTGHAAAQLLNLCGSTIVLAVYVFVAARVSAPMTAVVLACAATVGLLLHRRTRRSGDLGTAFTNARHEFQAAVADDLGGMKVIRSAGGEQRSKQRIVWLASELAAARAAGHFHHANSTVWLDVGTAATLSGLLLVAVGIMHLDAAAILLLLFLFARIVPRVGALQQTLHLYVNLLPAVDRFDRLEAQVRAAAARHDVREAAPFCRQLRFDAVSFRYTPQDPWVLNGVDFTVDAGTTVAIVGTSGVGKTTIVDLMIGLLSPDSGRITIDGVVLGDNAGSWRESIAYVPQDTFLFHDTIRANLTWVRPDASGDDINRALTLAMADFVHALPNGLDTVVGDRGVRLSGGERQRIALARALLRKPSLLILDEATSAIDRENEQRILEAIDRLRGSVTIVMITHRLAAVAGVDAVYVLDAGRIVECSVPA
jgi:ATP-binding cassette, subfamily C, bacterial